MSTFEVVMVTFKVIRNVLGTAGVLFAGYVVLASLWDARRYVRISSM